MGPHRRGHELANAMLLSAFEDRIIELPLDGSSYERVLQEKIADSARSKKELVTV